MIDSVENRKHSRLADMVVHLPNLGKEGDVPLVAAGGTIKC